MRLPSRIDAWLSNARAFQLFQLLRQGGLIVIAIALAHSGIGLEQIGYYEMLTYLGYLLTFFWVSGFMQGLLSQYNRLGIPERKQLVFQAFIVFNGAALLLALTLAVFEPHLLTALLQQQEVPYLWLFLAFLLTNLVASLQEHYYLLEKQKVSLVAYGAITTFLQVAVVAIPPLLGYSFRWSFIGLAILGVSKWVWLLRHVFVYGRWQWSSAIFRDWWKISWPLGLYALIAGLNQSAGPWLVGQFFAGDSTAFAVYRYGARELPLLSALAGALSSALIPVIASDTETGLQELKVETKRLYHLIFPISILLLLTAQYWFPFVFEAKFADSVPLFNTFLLLTCVHLLFARTILVALDNTRWIPAFAVVELVLQLFLGYLLAPKWGLFGIALAAVGSFAVEKIGLILFLQRRHGIQLISYTPWRWWLFYSGSLLAIFLWMR